MRNLRASFDNQVSIGIETTNPDPPEVNPMKPALFVSTFLLFVVSCHSVFAVDITYSDRATFIAALDSTTIEEDLEQITGELDFDNSSVNTVSPGALTGFDVSHSGDEQTTQFVDGNGAVNGAAVGNTTSSIQLIVDFAGTTGAFGANSNAADIGQITIDAGGVNAFGFDTYLFNDQGLDIIGSPQALGLEPGVLTTVEDVLGNQQSYTINSTDRFFGVVSTDAAISTITFAATPTYSSSGGELIAIDNFVGGVSSVPEPSSIILLAGGLFALASRRYRVR